MYYMWQRQQHYLHRYASPVQAICGPALPPPPPTPLVQATCGRNDVEKLVDLLKKGCPADTCDHNGRTGLLVCASAGYSEAVKVRVATHTHRHTW